MGITSSPPPIPGLPQFLQRRLTLKDFSEINTLIVTPTNQPWGYIGKQTFNFDIQQAINQLTINDIQGLIYEQDYANLEIKDVLDPGSYIRSQRDTSVSAN